LSLSYRRVQYFFGILLFISETMDGYYWMLLYLITKCYVSLPHGEVITLLRKGQPKKPDNNNNNFVASDQIINDDYYRNDDPNFDRKLDLVTAGARPFIREDLLTKITQEYAKTIVDREGGIAEDVDDLPELLIPLYSLVIIPFE
jgi:hypothetical protein